MPHSLSYAKCKEKNGHEHKWELFGRGTGKRGEREGAKQGRK
jgi:hypothetical protein